jgi:phospholipid transport system transporter-binding protein
VIRREGARLVVSGTATLATIADLLQDAARHLREGVTTIDLGEVKELDSSLLAALLGWRRLVRAQGGELRVENMPPALATIARLYGVDELLPAAA